MMRNLLTRSGLSRRSVMQNNLRAPFLDDVRNPMRSIHPRRERNESGQNTRTTEKVGCQANRSSQFTP